MADNAAPRRVSQNPGCLQCGRLDRLERVPAVVRDERSTGQVRGM